MSCDIPCIVGTFDGFLSLQAGFAYRSIAEFAKHVTKNTVYLGNFPFPELYKEVVVEESARDSVSEEAKITRTKPKSKSGVLGLRKKAKGKQTQEPIDEKGDEALDTPATTVPSPPLRDNAAAVEDIVTEGFDKEEGTSSTPQVRAYENIICIGFSYSEEKIRCHYTSGTRRYSGSDSTYGARRGNTCSTYPP